MAYIAKQIPDEEQNKFALSSPTTPTPIPPQAGGSAGAGDQARGAPPGVGTSTQFGSNAAKLSDYLKANESQVGDFGQKVAQNLSEGYNQAKGSIDTGFGNFNQQVQGGYTKGNDNLVNQAATNPTEFVKNKDNVSGFQSLYNDEYKGPQNFESSDVYSGVNNDVNKALEKSSLAMSPTGLGTYLGSYMGENNLTPGMQTLNSTLLQKSPDASKAIRDAAAPYSTLTDYLGSKGKDANALAQNAKSEAEGIRNSTQGRFVGENGLIPQYKQDLTNRLSQKVSTSKDDIKKALDDVYAGNPTAKDLSLFGMSPTSGDSGLLSTAPRAAQNLIDDYSVPVPLANYFNSQNPDVLYHDPASIASADDIAKGQALQQLTGQSLDTFLGSANPSAGNLINFDRNSLSQIPDQLSTKDVGNVSGVTGMDMAGMKQMRLQNPQLFTSTALTQMAQQKGLAGQDLKTFLNAAQRLGLVSDYVAPPTSPTGGSGVMHI